MCNDSGKTAEAPKKPGIPGWGGGKSCQWKPWWEWRVYWRVYIHIYIYICSFILSPWIPWNALQIECQIYFKITRLGSISCICHFPLPIQKNSFGPGWGSVQKTIWSWVTPRGGVCNQSSQPYQGRVRWVRYHDQPLRCLDVEPGWCTLLRSLRAIEDAWHFAKPLGTLGVVLLLAGPCHQGAQRIIYYLKSGWSFSKMVVIGKRHLECGNETPKELTSFCWAYLGQFLKMLRLDWWEINTSCN